MTTRRYLGLISGTSADGIDAALVDISHDGSVTTAAFDTFAYAEDLRHPLIEAAHSADRASYTHIAMLDQRVGLAFAEAAVEMLARSVDVPVVAVGSHGQTLFHSPRSAPAFTIQIGDPNRIAAAAKLPVVGDLRRMDMAAGGQGAPLASVLHRRALGHPTESRAVLNLGGIANLTLLPAGRSDVLGFDTGPASCLMDHWSSHVRDLPIDEDGQWAASGAVDEGLLARFLRDSYFDQKPPKSTGREVFSASWLEQALEGFRGSAATVQATLCELTACTVAQALTRYQPDCARLLVCGGGVHNSELLRRLRYRLPGVELESTAAYGLHPDAVEATLMGWLAWARMENIAGNLPSVTGAARSVLLGAIYDGSEV